jgi:hypothetical protein
VLLELDVLVPLEDLPCQYQVTPEGGVPLVSVLFPQLFVETEGVEGVPGLGFTVTLTPLELLQQPVEVFLALI